MREVLEEEDRNYCMYYLDIFINERVPKQIMQCKPKRRLDQGKTWKTGMNGLSRKRLECLQ
jgi:hypothetical protein